MCVCGGEQQVMDEGPAAMAMGHRTLQASRAS